jgi:hypothetical protein
MEIGENHVQIRPIKEIGRLAALLLDSSSTMDGVQCVLEQEIIKRQNSCIK